MVAKEESVPHVVDRRSESEENRKRAFNLLWAKVIRSSEQAARGW